MQTFRFTLALTLAACLSLQVGCGGPDPEPRGEKIQLRLNLKKGSTYKQYQGMVMDVDAGRENGSMEIGVGVSVNVLDVDPTGMHRMKMNFDSMKVNMDMGPIQVKYDSKTDKNPGGIAREMSAIVGKSLTMNVAPDGMTVGEVEGLANFPGGADLQQTMERMFGMYPDRPVDIRDSWTKTMNAKVNPQMPMTMTVVYTLYDRQNGKAILRFTGDIKTSGAMVLSGTVEGELTVDEVTGWVNDGTMSMEYGGKIQGQQVDYEAKVTLTDK